MGDEASPSELGETTRLQSLAQTVLRLIAMTIENIKEELTIPIPLHVHLISYLLLIKSFEVDNNNSTILQLKRRVHKLLCQRILDVPEIEHT